jgi:hypothetical protein
VKRSVVVRLKPDATTIAQKPAVTTIARPAEAGRYDDR